MPVSFHASLRSLPPQTSGRVSKALEYLLKLGKKNGGLLELELVGKGKIRSLNRKYRRKDKVTDVLSFPMHWEAPHRGAPWLIGSVVIAWPVALDQAKRAGRSAIDQAIRLAVHGWTHLSGLDHERSVAEARRFAQRGNTAARAVAEERLNEVGWLLAILSGTLAGLSYPTVFGGWHLPELGWLAFFAWIPLFIAIGRGSARRAFLYSFVAALAHYFISMYWIYTAMNSFGNISPSLSVAILFILNAVLSAYFGLIFYFSQRVCLRLGWPHWAVRPVFWIAFEFLRGHIPMGGYPWSQIGYSQGGFLAFIQSADLAGVYLTTFLLVLINESGYRLWLAWREHRAPLLKFPLMAIAAIFALNLGYGYYRLRETPPKIVQQIKTGIVQGNIPQDEKWQRGAAGRILGTFHEGTLAVADRGAELILWPEASYPLDLDHDAPTLPTSLTDYRADLLFGAVTRSHRFSGPRSQQPYYNTALLADAQGNVFDHYHKVHLVPFGEYVPYDDLFFFARKMTAQVGKLKPGDQIHPMKYRDRSLGVLICYEDIFPEIGRIMTAQGAQALINITNDAWYGNSSASYQHQVFSQFRAVESRRAVVRAANTGLSSSIDRYGRILWQSGLFTREDLITELPLYDDRSVYVRIGDLFCYIALAGALMLFGASLMKRRPAKE